MAPAVPQKHAARPDSPPRQIVVSLTPWEREILLASARTSLSVARSNATADDYGSALVAMHASLVAKLESAPEGTRG